MSETRTLKEMLESAHEHRFAESYIPYFAEAIVRRAAEVARRKYGCKKAADAILRDAGLAEEECDA